MIGSCKFRPLCHHGFGHWRGLLPLPTDLCACLSEWEEKSNSSRTQTCLLKGFFAEWEAEAKKKIAHLLTPRTTEIVRFVGNTEKTLIQSLNLMIISI